MPQCREPGRSGAASAPRHSWGRLWRRLWRAGGDRRLAAATLYRAVVDQARTPVLFRAYGVPDTPEGRFEMIALHAALVLRRLRREGECGRLIGQALFDLMFADMDSGLRELGVSDLSVGTYVKRLARNFYARLAAFDRGWGDPGQAAAAPAAGRSLHPMLRTNVYHGGTPPSDAQLAALADYLVAQERGLANQKGESICRGEIAWVAAKELPGTPAAGSGCA